MTDQLHGYRVFVFAYTKSRFSHDADHLLGEEVFDEIECFLIFEPRHEKTGYLHMRKQRCRSASW